MFSAVLLLAASLSGADVVLPPDVVHITPNEAQPLELVSQTLSKNGQDLTLVFSAEKDSFFVDFDFAGTDYKTATITVKDTKDWRSIDYYTQKSLQGFPIDLLRLKGVRVERSKDKKDCVITFSPRGYKVLPPGGTLRFLALPDE
jgi:hypothetical protein